MRALAMVLALGLLAGCGSKETAATKGTSFGEVLPGSASDAMLPYDTATSAPPLEAPGAAMDSATSPSRGSATDASPVEADTVPEVEAT